MRRLALTRFRLSPAVSTVLLLISFGSLRGGKEEVPERHEFQQMLMGTVFRLVLYSPSAEHAAEIASEAFQRIEEIEASLSDFQGDSELSRALSEAAARPVRLSPDLFTVLFYARRLAGWSHGAFDPTVKPLVLLWKEAQKKNRPPERREIEEARRRVGYEKILLNERTRSLRLRQEEVRIDLGAVGKGYAAEEAFRLIVAGGIESALVDAGGDLRFGHPPPKRRGWEIVVDSAAGDLKKLLLRDRAVATSGDKYQYVEAAGRRYSHIVDPRTGMGVEGPRVVTVLAADAMVADGLATALSVMKPGEGLALVERLKDLEARIELRDGAAGAVYLSSGFPP